MTREAKLVFVPCGPDGGNDKYTVQCGTEPGTFRVLATCDTYGEAERLAVAMKIGSIEALTAKDAEIAAVLDAVEAEADLKNGGVRKAQSYEAVCESTYICCLDKGCGDDCEAVVAGSISRAVDLGFEAAIAAIRERLSGGKG